MPGKKEEDVLLTETLSSIRKQVRDLEIKKEILQKKAEYINKRVDTIKEEKGLIERSIKVLIKEQTNLHVLLDEELKLVQEKETIKKELSEIRKKVLKIAELSKKIIKD